MAQATTTRAQLLTFDRFVELVNTRGSEEQRTALGMPGILTTDRVKAIARVTKRAPKVVHMGGFITAQYPHNGAIRIIRLGVSSRK